ncbi:DNA-binding protein [Mycobacterium sp. IEC1808]|uniref:YbaB/EbfC family nucleoid-associated protein n=1 Tax=Mycobacterium sp. IEC1808 TaxID=1743230 RepID=UPI000A169FDC|nr:YbaB/EbfC family nucleoid-associated protein [Mycobacterium sp. IEC1808]ORW87508.1 DNA-binding protein [Mycobacterium sp. IEC1808]
MSIETQDQHPQVGEALQQLKHFNAVLEDQMYQTSTESFTGSDEAETVNVTVNGQHAVTGVFIEDGLLRLGAQTVEERVNEALRNAQVAATAAISEQQQQVFATLLDATEQLMKAAGLT